MPAFTIHIAVHTEAANASEAVNDVERRLATFERVAEQAGIVFDVQAVTDEMGEDVDLRERVS